MQLLITVCSRPKVTIGRCDAIWCSPGSALWHSGIEITSQLTIRCPCLWVCKCLVCWTRLLPVTLSGDCEIVALRQRPAEPNSELWDTNCDWRMANAALNLWETSTAAMGETKCPGTPLMAVGNVTRTWRLCKQEDANWQQRRQTAQRSETWKLANCWQWGNSWPETRVNTVRRGFLTWLPATSLVVVGRGQGGKGNRNPNSKPKPKSKRKLRSPAQKVRPTSEPKTVLAKLL